MKKFQFLPLLVLLLPFVLLYANWEPLDEVPADVGAGGAITYGGQYIWCIVGGDDASFYAYDIHNEEWVDDLDDVPEDISGSAAIAYESGIDKRIFVATGRHLWIYTRDSSDTEGSWNNEEDTIVLPFTCGPGVAMAYQPVVEDSIQRGGYLYVLFGGYQAYFRRCFIAIADTLIPHDNPLNWDTLEDFPGAPYAGAALCFNHRNTQGDQSESLFALVGDGQNTFYSYKIGSDDWDNNEPSTPLPQNNGSSIASGRDGKKLYTIFGVSENIEDYWAYKLSDRDWHPCDDDLPDTLRAGASITFDADHTNAYLVIGGDRDGFYIDENTDTEIDPYEKTIQSVGTFTISSKPRVSTSPEKIVIHYSTKAANKVTIQIYDLMGKRVKSLCSSNVEKGDHQIIWNKTDNSNCKVASGIYFITIEQENKPERLKVIIR